MSEAALNAQILLEKRIVFTPLGIRFWDMVLDKQVADDLIVTTRPAAANRPIVAAFRTASGIYAFQGLPGLSAVEYPTADAADAVETSPPDPVPFITEIIDRRHRFLPVAIKQELPLPYRGVFPSDAAGSPPDGSPPNGGPPGFYLCSAPTRPVVSGLAVVRAQLQDWTTREPAAYAILEVQINDGEPWCGVADHRGCVAVFFPYPTFTVTLNTSPPSGPPLAQQKWEATIRVRYAPSTLEHLTPVTIPNLRSIPDYYSILKQLKQPPGLIYTTENEFDDPVESWEVELAYGQELVASTRDLSTLLISPVASLP
jgi:hypothetical protein